MAEPGSSHLSIGEVLGLLLEEFPDVTISKIRFLESQGLIEPERTPSGYRKFFDDDVELLRLILREQREKFLPLRVIKDRIDSGEIETSAELPAAGPDPNERHGREQPSEAEVAKHPAARRAAPVADSIPGPPTEEPPTEEPPTEEPPTEEPPAAEEPPETPPPRKRRRPTEQPASPAATLLPGVLVNREELCAMASITRAQLAQLEDYGVISHRAGVDDLYGDEAVEIASAAGGFLRAGIDARHLRAWRTSVEREAGLYEQLILPLLRQRNPQARGQAAARLDELDGLGTKLRAAMMRAALRQYMEG
jgi:DNA-binding transcriptional MerR regulator